MVTACRYWYELTDGFWGQFVSTQIPHAKPEDILPTEKYLHTMINFFGMIDYLSRDARYNPREGRRCIRPEGFASSAD